MKEVKDIEEKLKDLSREVAKTSLKQEDKNVLRSQLEAYVKENPILEDSSFYQKNVSALVKGGIIGIIGSFLVGGGMAYAAEGALPGHSLYSIKVNFNEKVLSLAAVSDEAEARLQAELAERRIEEVGKLAARGELSPQEERNLQERFEKHSQASQEHLGKIKGERSNEIVAEIQSRFEAAIAVHEQLFTQLARGNSSSSEGYQEILEGVEQNKEKEKKGTTTSVVKESNDVNASAGETPGNATTSVTGTSSASNTAQKASEKDNGQVRMQNVLNWIHKKKEEISKKRGESEHQMWTSVKSQERSLIEETQELATQELEKAKTFLRKNRNNMKTGVRIEAQKYIEDAERSFTQGEENFESESYSDAFGALRNVIRQALKAQILVKTSAELDSYIQVEGFNEEALEVELQEDLEEAGSGKAPQSQNSSSSKSAEDQNATSTGDSKKSSKNVNNQKSTTTSGTENISASLGTERSNVAQADPFVKTKEGTQEKRWLSHVLEL